MIDEAALALDDGGQGVRAWSEASFPVRLIEIGVAGALTGVLMILFWLEPRPDLALATLHVLFWMKAAYTAGLALAALALATALSRGASPRLPGLAAGLLVLVILLAAVVEAVGLAPEALARLLRPAGAIACLRNVLIVAAPMLAFATWGLKGLRLERPVALGLAAGLFSGGLSASVYGLHCPQASLVFVGLWYTAAVALCGGVGAGAMRLLARPGMPEAEPDRP